MGEAQEVQLQIMGKESKEASHPEHENETNQPEIARKRSSAKWWLLMAVYSLLLLAGQSVAVLLGRLYFEKGGSSKWMGALVQPAGFPILLPFYLSQPRKSCHKKLRNKLSF
ncbi:PURINE PERMEASE 21-RELATED [Salix koriyanagi]|uniref:PURINE PERMEASE 21-RELATED n=1 Tax=Salix koriyanagi TaxID=2511006 RepID=A0A9Q0X0M1_9ROSI|nr:PURINE PERMEASE 21-RELATED [Salix koriyanagi]